MPALPDQTRPRQAHHIPPGHTSPSLPRHTSLYLTTSDIDPPRLPPRCQPCSTLPHYASPDRTAPCHACPPRHIPPNPTRPDLTAQDCALPSLALPASPSLIPQHPIMPNLAEKRRACLAKSNPTLSGNNLIYRIKPCHVNQAFQSTPQ
jgi:hypothetical protein